METETEEEYNCPICINIPTGKIFQCREGHILCESCLCKIQQSASLACRPPKCPSCAVPVSDVAVSRNRVLENMLDRLSFDCPYAKNGCRQKFKRSGFKEHEATCVYGARLQICWIFGHQWCKFCLSVATAKNVLHHIKSNHSYSSFGDNRVSRLINLKVQSRIFNCILKVSDIGSPKHVLICTEVTKHFISFYSVDISLGLSLADNLVVTFSIPNDPMPPLLSWSFPVACGISSWKFLRDRNRPKQIQIDIQSLLQHCDDEGYLEIIVEVKSYRKNLPAPDLFYNFLIILAVLFLVALAVLIRPR